MRLHKKQGATAPTVQPEQTASSPEAGGKRRGLAVAALVVVGAAAAWYTLRTPETTAPVQTVAIRTSTIGSGTLERTIRLTGTTQAERSANLIAPRMGGRRGGSFGGGISGRGGGTMSSAPSGAGAPSTTSSSLGSSASGSSARSSSGGSANLRSATTRFSTGSSSSSSRTSSSSSSGSSSSMSGGGLATLGGGGGGGGGGANFQLTLETVVPPGSHVKKGDVIAEFDRQYMLERLDDFRANVEQDRVGMKRLLTELDVEKQAHQQSIEIAKASLEKARLDVKTIPVQSAIDSEKLKLAVEEAEAYYNRLLKEVPLKDAALKAELRNSELDFNEEQLELKRAEANVDRMLIRAPIDGITVMSTLRRGPESAQVRAGDQLRPGMMYMQVVDPSSMIVNATLSQTDLELVRIGSKATVRFDAYPDLVLPAHIHSIGAIAKAGSFRAQYVAQVPVVLHLDRMDPRVIPDVSVSADVVVERHEAKAPVAPLGSIFSDPATNKPIVYVRRNGQWEKRQVELGLSNYTHAIVRSGLRPGEVVAAEVPVLSQKQEASR